MVFHVGQNTQSLIVIPVQNVFFRSKCSTMCESTTDTTLIFVWAKDKVSQSGLSGPILDYGHLG